MYSDTTGDERRPLLPEQLENGLFSLASRMVGVGLIAAGLFCWLALLSWSAQDPSLTHAAGGSARNWMGAPGAIISDLLLQTLGLATLFALLAPAAWGFDCLVKGRLLRVRWKLAVMTLAVLMLAGGLSALPMPASWPLHHGLGGILGDLVYRLAASLLGVFNPARAGAAAGLMLLAGGMSALACGLGISYQDVSLVLRSRPRVGSAALAQSLWVAAKSWPVASAGWVSIFATAKARPDSAPREPTLDLGPLTTGSKPHARSDEQLSRIDDEMTPIRILEICRPQGSEASVAERGIAGGDLLPHESVRQSPPKSGVPETSRVALRGTRLLLQQELANLGVHAEVTDARPGPVVTEFEVELAPGIRAERVESLADDIALAMNSDAARISIAPGGRQVAIELANAIREPVQLSDLILQAPSSADAILPVILGRSALGQPMLIDLARLQNLLVAGTASSGRSMALKAMVLSLTRCRGPAECQLLLIDPRQRQSALADLPHLLSSRVTNPAHGVAALGWVVDQMHERVRRLSALGLDNIDAFNGRVRDARKRGAPLARSVQTGFDHRTGMPVYEREVIAGEILARIVVVVDELADLMVRGASEVEDAIRTLSECGSAAGIHVVVGTDRPTSDVLTPVIARAIRNRIALRTVSRADSRAVLGAPGAERLLGDGDMLLAGPGGSIVRVHGATVSDEEAESIVAGLRADGRHVGEPAAQSSRPEPARDALYDKVVAVMARFELVSAAMLASKLGADRSQIEGVLARLQRDGIIQSCEHRGWYRAAGNPTPKQRLRA